MRTRITSQRIEVLNFLLRYRYITTRFILRLIPRDIKLNTINRALYEMRYAALVEKPEKSRWTNNSLYKDDAYEISTRGKNALKSHDSLRPFPRDYANFFHDQFTSLCAAAFEIMCVEHPDLEYFSWWDIVKSPKVPQDTIESAKPHLLQIDKVKGIQDYAPFAVGHKNKRRVFFMGIEADMATEQRSTGLTSSHRATLEKKYSFWMNVFRKEVYRSHYGFPNAYIVFLFSSEGSMQSAMQLFEDRFPEGSTKVLFGHAPNFRRLERSADVEDFTTMTWNRVGHGDFHIEAHLTR
ncbi:MAG: hypothetical protein AB8C02_00175 [Halioglobus sp.]